MVYISPARIAKVSFFANTLGDIGMANLVAAAGLQVCSNYRSTLVVASRSRNRTDIHSVVDCAGRLLFSRGDGHFRLRAVARRHENPVCRVGKRVNAEAQGV